MSFLVRHFVHEFPQNGNRPVRRIRRGAATVFVDRETGYLIAGYSYNTCLFAVFADDSVDFGSRLFVNEARYSVTTESKHRNWLRGFIAPCFSAQWTWDYEAGRSIMTAPCLAGPPADTLSPSSMASAHDLREACLRQPSVASCVAA